MRLGKFSLELKTLGRKLGQIFNQTGEAKVRDLLHRERLDACIELLVAHVVRCLTRNEVNVQLWNHVWLHMLIQIVRCVEVLVCHVLNDGCRGDALSTVSLVYRLGQLLDGQSQVKELMHAEIRVADIGLSQAQDNVPGQDLVRCHHGKDVLSLVKDATLRNRYATKLQAGSRHQLQFLLSFCTLGTLLSSLLSTHLWSWSAPLKIPSGNVNKEVDASTL